MERSKHHDLQDFPRQMERFLMANLKGGVTSYRLQRTSLVPIEHVTWIALFPLAFRGNFPTVAAGELNRNEPLSKSYVKSLIIDLQIPQDSQAEDLTFSIGDDPNPPTQSFDVSMPTVGVLFLPAHLTGEETVVLKAVSTMTTPEALSEICDALEDGLISGN